MKEGTLGDKEWEIVKGKAEVRGMARERRLGGQRGGSRQRVGGAQDAVVGRL